MPVLPALAAPRDPRRRFQTYNPRFATGYCSFQKPAFSRSTYPVDQSIMVVSYDCTALESGLRLSEPTYIGEEYSSEACFGGSCTS